MAGLVTQITLTLIHDLSAFQVTFITPNLIVLTSHHSRKKLNEPVIGFDLASSRQGKRLSPISENLTREYSKEKPKLTENYSKHSIHVLLL